MSEVVEITECRSCGSGELKEIISLGEHYISNFIESEEEQEKIPKVPLELILCEDCKLLQLRHNAPQELMWNEQYWYKSAINRMIRDDLKDIIENTKKLVDLKKGEMIIDIGCNDGTMFDFCDKDNLVLVGFEPSGNVAREAESKGFKIINNFFNAEDFKKEFGDKKAKVITAISMFYDLEDPNKFLGDIVSILDKEGLFIIQQNYLVSMLKQNAIDNICHEHREYYSLYPLKNLLDKHGLEIFDLSLNDINGGSIRTYIRFKGSKKPLPLEGAEERISGVEKEEKEMELHTSKPYQEFASRIDNTKKQLLEFFKRERAAGKVICGCGASTRGNTTLQYFGLGPDLITCIFDRNPDKWGKKTIGSLIPVESPDRIDEFKPDYQLVLIWHIFKGIGDDEKEFVKKGGKFILPFPKIKIIDKIED